MILYADDTATKEQQAALKAIAKTLYGKMLKARFGDGGLDLSRGLVFIDTLHPVHEGSLFRWGWGPNESPLVEYGRTDADALAAMGASPAEMEAAGRWRLSPFYTMLQTGDALLRRAGTIVQIDPLPHRLPLSSIIRNGQCPG